MFKNHNNNKTKKFDDPYYFFLSDKKTLNDEKLAELEKMYYDGQINNQEAFKYLKSYMVYHQHDSYYVRHLKESIAYHYLSEIVGEYPVLTVDDFNSLLHFGKESKQLRDQIKAIFIQNPQVDLCGIKTNFKEGDVTFVIKKNTDHYSLMAHSSEHIDYSLESRALLEQLNTKDMQIDHLKENTSCVGTLKDHFIHVSFNNDDIYVKNDEKIIKLIGGYIVNNGAVINDSHLSNINEEMFNEIKKASNLTLKEADITYDDKMKHFVCLKDVFVFKPKTYTYCDDIFMNPGNVYFVIDNNIYKTYDANLEVKSIVNFQSNGWG